MTLTDFETKLKQANPNLHIKRYGTSMAAIHLGTRHICRVPQGEITLYNVTEEADGHRDDLVSTWNPTGAYKWQRLVRRGRGEAVHMLQMGGIITQAQAAQLRN